MRYEEVWNAVDKLAKLNGLSPSGLAKKAGLDATTFNKSKRIRADGKKRFPSLESINKIISVCNITFDQFCKLSDRESSDISINSIPYINYSDLENKKDITTEPDTSKWSKIKFPDGKHSIYGIEIDYDINQIFKKGRLIVVSKNSEIRREDKVIISYNDGNIYTAEFIRRTATTVEILNLASPQKEISLLIKDINFINRILWVSL